MSPLRVTLVGGGANIAAAHLHALEVIGAQVVAVQDVDFEKAERIAEHLGCAAATELEEALREPSELAVVLAPHPFHAELVMACLEAGRHVLVEKPIADAVDRADAMAACAQRAGRRLAVALQHRTRPEVQQAHALVHSGALGQLQRADLIGTWPRRRTYFSTAPWRGTWRNEGGGVVINQGQHDLDLLTYLAGPPERVVAWTRTRLHAIETEDTAVALLEWPQGAVGSVHLSTCEIDHKQRLELTGTAGRLVLLPGRLEVTPAELDMRRFIETPGPAFGTPAPRPTQVTESDAPLDHVGLYRNLAQALRSGAPLVASAEAATSTLEVANAMLLSAARGREVRLPLDRAEYATFLAERRRAHAR